MPIELRKTKSIEISCGSAFEAINRYCRTETGFSSITDVDAAQGGSKGDV